MYIYNLPKGFKKPITPISDPFEIPTELSRAQKARFWAESASNITLKGF